MKLVFLTFGIILGVELLSLLCFFYPVFSFPLLAIIFFASLILFIKKPEIGIYVVGTELVIGSFGRLIASGITLRMVLFCALMIAWIINEVKNLSSYEKLRIPLSIIVLLGLVALQSFHGYISNFSLSSIISDANSYLFFLLTLPLSRYSKKIDRKIAKNIFFVAIVWLSIKTLLIFAIFTHLLQPFFDSWWYHWIRDTRVGEITGYGNGLVRVFFQSHLYAAVGAILLLCGNFFTQQKRFVLLTLSFATLLLSLSRSIWIGVIFGLLTLIIYKMYKKNLHWLDIRIFVFSCVGSVFLISFLYYLPVGIKTTEPLYRLFTLRAENLSQETAALSRWQQLPLLWDAITKKPLLGYGFGSSLLVGGISKSAFEWGWLDIWFKMGIAGVLIYAWIIFYIGKNIIHKENIYPLLTLLIITHAFTPYLNHPLGIGILLGLLYFETSF